MEKRAVSAAAAAAALRRLPRSESLGCCHRRKRGGREEKRAAPFCSGINLHLLYSHTSIFFSFLTAKIEPPLPFSARHDGKMAPEKERKPKQQKESFYAKVFLSFP